MNWRKFCVLPIITWDMRDSCGGSYAAVNHKQQTVDDCSFYLTCSAVTDKQMRTRHQLSCFWHNCDIGMHC